MNAGVEAELRAHHQAGRLTDAATLAVRAYGPEILGWLVAARRDEAAASEIFSVFLEDLWKGLAGFAWESSFRTWAYVVARHAWLRHERTRARRPRHLSLDDAPEVATVAEKVRTTTLMWLRTEVKDRITRLRESLDPEEQTLLILRINRKMEWNDIARILAAEGETLDGPALTRRSATIRKRYERVVAKLRALATEA